ncbi:MAG: YdcF family protein [Candidatus Cryptobacteroides sp.]
MKMLKLLFGAAILLSVASGCESNVVTPAPVPDPGPGTEPDTPPVVEEFSIEPSQDYELVEVTQLVTKECYFLSLLRNLPEMRAIVSRDEFLNGVESAKFSRLSESSDMNEKFQALRFTAAEISQIGDYFESLWEAGNSWDRLVTGHLVPSGCYYYTNASSAQRMLRAAWAHDAQIVNMIVDIYGTGTRDAHCTDDRRTATEGQLAEALATVQAKTSASGFFTDIAVEGMYYILKAHEREQEPTLFEPHKLGCNLAACQALSSTDFSKYDYSAIIVLGGSDETTNFVQQAQERCDYAYTKWKAKKAPFIIVTGGRIHPFKTKDNEAETMKNYLMNKGIPESVIIMEPQARHTPTNFRNVSRVLWRYGFPFEKEALMVMQSYIMDDMEAEAFRQRCYNEFGFMPITFGPRLDTYSKKLFPSKNSLTLGSIDPLDP